MRMNRATCGRPAVAVVTVIAMGILASPAAAQGRPAPPKLTASVAAGVAVPIDVDSPFNAIEWQAAIRRDVSPHFLVEGFFDQWRHSSDRTSEGRQLLDASGVIGSYGSLTQNTVHVTRTVGVNALLRGSIGRVSITGGGGAGHMVYRRTFRQDLTECQSSVPQVCDRFQNNWESSGMSVQGLIGADLQLSSRLVAFGQFKFTGPVESLYASHGSFTGGVRVGLR